MRISDWSSDVCSSDLCYGSRKEPVLTLVEDLKDSVSPQAAVGGPPLPSAAERREGLRHLLQSYATHVAAHDGCACRCRRYDARERLERRGRRDAVSAYHLGHLARSEEQGVGKEG